MNRYVIVHRNSGLYVKKRINYGITYINSLSEAIFFSYLTTAIEFGDKYITDGYDIYEIVLKKV